MKIGLTEWPDSSGEDDHGREGRAVAMKHGYGKAEDMGKSAGVKTGKTYQSHGRMKGSYVTVDQKGNWAHVSNGAGKSGTGVASLNDHLNTYHGHSVKENQAMKNNSLLLVEDGVTKSASFESIRDKVSSALDNQIKVESNDSNCYCWIANMYPTQVVYSIGGDYYLRSYAFEGDVVHLGPPVEVEQSWTPAPDADDAQESFKECSRLPIVSLHQLQESYNASTGEITMTVIKPGFNVSKSRFYPAEVLKRDYKIFEGAKMFGDHLTESEQRTKPEGSVHNWVATINKVWAENDGTVKAKATVVDPPFKAKLDRLNEVGQLKDMGVSIRAVGEANKQKIEGTETLHVESLVKARSVDFVTYAGAGGMVEAMESERGEADLDLVSFEELALRRPDLVKLIESKHQEESMKTLEQQLQEATAALTEANTKLAAANVKIEESEKAAKKAVASTELTKLLTESKLPEAAQTKIKNQFSEAVTVAGMKEAVDSEKEYIKSISTGAGVKNLGTAEVTESDKEAGINLVESFVSMGMSKEQAEAAAKGL